MSYVTPKYSPGETALKAAYEYYEGRFESPGLAAQHWLVERQHVNYYVRKLAAQGLVSSKMSTSRASIEPMMPISLDEPDGGVAEEVSAHETWCAVWRFAAELGNTMGRRAAATQTREKFQINFSRARAPLLCQMSPMMTGGGGRRELVIQTLIPNDASI